MAIDCESALKQERGQPVAGFGISFCWHPAWASLFDAQVDAIRRNIGRARADGKMIVYLSCPISARGGGNHKTNVEIALSVERLLLDKWGERFWILNPAQYQMESDHGESMMQEHADKLGIDLAGLRACYPKDAPAPSGGDYMRMWTKVLVEDGPVDAAKRPYYVPSPVPGSPLQNSGQHFDAFYFLGPRDIQEFFTNDGTKSLSLAIEGYFATKFDMDADFRDAYSIDGIAWGTDYKHASDAANQIDMRAKWEALRRDFLRFYSLRASVTFSLGSHDEWNIFRLINEKRRKRYGENDNRGIAEQLAGFFDGVQIDSASTETILSNGYAL
jgi:hypothetical protein